MPDPTHWLTVLPPYLAALAAGYLLGSVPFGLIITQLAGTADIRTVGSGNIGATNVLRTGRRELAAATLLCDILKGTIAVTVVDWFLGEQPALVAALGAFLGHIFPMWLGFRGGKGVATYLGVLLGLVPWPGAAAFAAIWVTVAALTRYSSLSALVACAATPGVLWAAGNRREAMLFALLTVIIFVAHRANIARLMAGTEGKIGSASRDRARTG